MFCINMFDLENANMGCVGGIVVVPFHSIVVQIFFQSFGGIAIEGSGGQSVN